MVDVLTDDMPRMDNMTKIPLPGKAQALSCSSDRRHFIAFDNNMHAVLAEKTYSSFRAFSLAELLEFSQLVEWIGASQPEEEQELAESVVYGVRVIVYNSIRVQAALRDAGKLGDHGEVFKAYAYLQIYYLVMFREVFDCVSAEMFFIQYAQDFAIKARGCPGMALSGSAGSGSSSNGSSKACRCLVCGKAGHRANEHSTEMAEGTMDLAGGQLQKALTEISNDDKLTPDQKRTWMVRTKGFWRKIQKDRADGVAEAAL